MYRESINFTLLKNICFQIHKNEKYLSILIKIAIFKIIWVRLNCKAQKIEIFQLNCNYDFLSRSFNVDFGVTGKSHPNE